MNNLSANPLIAPANTPFGAFPFPNITPAHIEEACIEGMRRENEEIERIATNPEPPTFENTIAALECCGELLERATSVLYNLSSAETCDELDDVATRLSPKLSAHSTAIMHNAALFQRVKTVREQATNLDEEAAMLLDKTYEGFERCGATLNGEGKKRFEMLSAQLAEATLTFSQNHLRETNAYELHLTDNHRLSGLPQTQLDAAAAEAKGRGKEGYVFTLKGPSYAPFMTYADDRELRHELFMAYNTQCTRPDNSCNFPLVERIVNLRRELAQLLGYDTYAQYALRRRMAGQPEKVYALLNDLIAHYEKPARRELDDITAIARETEGATFQLQPWDFSYYAHKLRLRRYDLDAEMLRPYFPLEQVRQGVFALATRLYGLTFQRREDIPVYHPDVEAYEVKDADGSMLALLYLDFFPRQGKQSGAWMTNYKEQWLETDGTDSRPHVSVVTNFTKPTDERPSLLTHGEVQTFLHEFGHALHGMLSRCRYRSISGTNVWWDFVELPSQLMENYALEPDFLRTFARHYQTGEVIPNELIRKLRDSRHYGAAYACMRQVSFGLLDMAYYDRRDQLPNQDIPAFERQAWQRARLLPEVDGTCMTVQFGHIMSGGYAAGYYSYKWAEVLDADAFDCFRQEGIFNPHTAARLRRCILERGGSRHPAQLYRDFRGAEPTLQALLRRDGLLSDEGQDGTSPADKAIALDRRYLRMARIWAENSYCTRRQVGALIVKDKMIISDGYNGTPSGFENVCEDEQGLTKPYVLHAEANAITKIARSGNNSDGATLYVTDSPCIECAKLIIQAGIRRVVYAKQYRLTEGVDLLRRAGIEIVYLP